MAESPAVGHCFRLGLCAVTRSGVGRDSDSPFRLGANEGRVTDPPYRKHPARRVEFVVTFRLASGLSGHPLP